MKKTLALLACALLATSLASAQSKTAHKPSSGVTQDPTLSTEAATPARPANPNALPVGTAIKMKLETPVNTAVTKPGDSFAGRVTQAVSLNGRTIIPVGSSITGFVLKAEEPKRAKGVPTIVLHPQTVMLPDGSTYAMSAVTVDVQGVPKTHVDDEGNIKGSGINTREKVEMAAGTGGGAMIGGLIGGGKGALGGAAVGATITVGHWLMSKHGNTLPAGSEIIMELSREMVVAPATTAQGN